MTLPTTPQQTTPAAAGLPAVPEFPAPPDRGAASEKSAPRARDSGDLAAGIARELQVPLQAIASAAQLVRFRSRDDPVVDKNIGKIITEADRLSRFAASLAEFGRSLAPVLHPRDPDGILDQVLAESRGLMESRSLALSRGRAHPHAHCAVDSERLALSFENLVASLCESAPEGSDVTITSVLLPDGAWRCALHTAGRLGADDAGASPFDLFAAAAVRGRGFTLPLARRIIDQHRGSIAMEASSEYGTTVTVTLPSA